jgi:hypothetical protein
MKASALLLVAILVAATAAAADPPLVDGVSGAPLDWTEWVAKHGPVAVIVWASWAPGAATVVNNSKAFVDASRLAGWKLALLDVQESLDDGRKALAGSDLTWIHDRHGALLKLYRVIEVPSVVVIAADGSVLQRLQAKPEALTGGGRR